jgi:hypothetical protein
VSDLVGLVLQFPRRHIDPISISERKIDNLVDNVDEIRRVLKDTCAAIPDAEQRFKILRSSSRNLAANEALSLNQSTPATGSSAQWEHSAHLVDFVRDIVEKRTNAVPGDSVTLASLRRFLRTAETQVTFQIPPISTCPAAKNEEVILPPVEATAAVVRWARGLLLPVSRS